jgi:hypothetical protein
MITINPARRTEYGRKNGAFKRLEENLAVLYVESFSGQYRWNRPGWLQCCRLGLVGALVGAAGQMITQSSGTAGVARRVDAATGVNVALSVAARWREIAIRTPRSARTAATSANLVFGEGFRHRSRRRDRHRGRPCRLAGPAVVFLRGVTDRSAHAGCGRRAVRRRLGARVLGPDEMGRRRPSAGSVALRMRVVPTVGATRQRQGADMVF